VKRKISVLFLLIPLILLLAYLLKDYVHRYILAPVLYTLRIERILYEAFPQPVWWGIFLFVLAVIAIRSLLRGYQSTSVDAGSLNEDRMSRARSWSRWIEMSYRGNYSKWLLARHLADLASNILVYQERQPLERIRARIMNSEADIPPDIQDYLQIGLNMPSFRHYSEFLGDKSWLRLPSRYQLAHLIRSTLRFGSILRAGSTLRAGNTLHNSSTLRNGNTLPTTPLNLDPEVIVQFLETTISSGGSV